MRTASRRVNLGAGAGASALVALIGYRLGALSGSGAAGAIGVGTAVLSTGGPGPGTLLGSFFLSSSFLSRWRGARKRVAQLEAVKGTRRDLGQVLANGGVAAIAALAGSRNPALAWNAAFIGAVATVNADTWATEIGTFSPDRPWLITTLARVAPGTSGAVSRLGLVATLAGAAWIGWTARLAGARRGAGWRDEARAQVLVATVSGTAGSLLDSLLGATVQARYRCDRCATGTEKSTHYCGEPTRLIAGFPWLDNDVVNFLSSAGGAAVAALLATTIVQHGALGPAE